MTDRWYTEAACAGDPSTMFPGSNADTIEKARRICTACPVTVECLQDALDTEVGNRYGVRGGMTPGQRRRIHVKGQTAEQALTRPPRAVPTQAATLEEAFKRRVKETGDGHLLWSGGRTFTWRGEEYAPSRTSFALEHGREPVGKVFKTCQVQGCVAGPCMADQPMRAAL